MTSTVLKRSIIISGHKTSVSLEDAFWTALQNIAKAKDRYIHDIVAEINAGRLAAGHTNLSSAIRVFVLEYVTAERDEFCDSLAVAIAAAPDAEMVRAA